MELISELVEQMDELAGRREARHKQVAEDAIDRLDHAIAEAVDFLIAGGMKGSDAVKAVIGHLNEVVMGYDLEGASGLGMEEEEEDRGEQLRRIMKAERERQERDRGWRKKMAETPKRKPLPSREPTEDELRRSEEVWKSYGEERARATGAKWTGD